MAEPADYLDEVGEVVEELARLGLQPILVGGMALVILGSRRVTRDFDFVTVQPIGVRMEEMLDALYDRGLELVSRLHDNGDVAATMSNRRVASVRLRVDAPSSAYFFNPLTALRIDLLFDFPIPAAQLAKDATRLQLRSRVFRVASEANLLRLKRIAQCQRSFPGDAEDIAFLEARRK